MNKCIGNFNIQFDTIDFTVYLKFVNFKYYFFKKCQNINVIKIYIAIDIF